MKIQVSHKSKINNPTEFIPMNDPAFVSSFEGVFDERFFKDPTFIHLGENYESYLRYQVHNLDIQTYIDVQVLHLQVQVR